MTSREIVRRTLDFEKPERVARSFGDSDFTGAGNTAKTYATKWKETGNGRWERYDEWGNLWGRVDATSKGEVIRGVLEDMDRFNTYEFPDFSNADDYASAARARREQPDKWLIGNMPGFAFNIARKLRKLDQYLVDLMLEPRRMHKLHDRIDSLLEDMIRNYASAGVDSVMFPEDWGTQASLMINPELWHQEFYPRFQRLCGIARECGIRVFMHSCGQTESIVPGLISAGVDLLQFDQPELHGINTLAGHQEKSNITFWCPVDIQRTLQTGNANAIRAGAREMLEKLWRGRGGFVAGYYGDNESIGLDPKWQGIACDEFIRYGVAENFTTL